MRKKTSSRYNKKRTKSRVGSNKQLEGLTYHYRDIQWFWQFLKLAVKFFNKLDFMRQVCECSANVIVPTQNKIQKGEFLLAFFLFLRKTLVMQELI